MGYRRVAFIRKWPLNFSLRVGWAHYFNLKITKIEIKLWNYFRKTSIAFSKKKLGEENLYNLNIFITIITRIKSFFFLQKFEITVFYSFLCLHCRQDTSISLSFSSLLKWMFLKACMIYQPSNLGVVTHKSSDLIIFFKK